MFGKKQPDAMALDVFVRESILNIFRGVFDAQAELYKQRGDNKATGAIFPVPNDPAHVNWKDQETQIEFDILVSIEHQNTGKADAKLEVVAMAGGLATERAKTSATENRLKFSVPVVFTGMPTEKYGKS